MKAEKAKGNWEKEGCKCTVVRDPENHDKILKMFGAYTNGVATSVFSVRFQSKGEYDLRGSISIRSVRTGQVLRAEKTGNPVSADIRINANTKTAIKNKIVETFERLYQAHVGVVFRDIGQSRSDDLPLSFAIHVFGREFLIKEMHATEDILKRRLREMGKIATPLDKYPMAKIPMSSLEDIRTQLGASSDDGFQFCWKLIRWLQVTHKFFGENPFEKYYDRYPKRTPKSLESVIEAANRAKSLPDPVFRGLAAEIASAPSGDVKTTGMLLIHNAGLSATDACNLTWQQVIFDGVREGSCQLAVRNDETVGATHDYMHPIFPFGARELRRRYDDLIQSNPKLGEQKVLQGLEPKILTAHCRTRLHHLGISAEVLSQEKGKGQTGGGVKLLQKDYYYRLTYHCGMRNEGELNFMRTLSMGTDVTTDNYRSLSSPSGQRRLQLMVKRDTRLEPMPPKRAPKIDQSGNQTTVIATPQDPGRTTVVSMRVKLKKGDRLIVSSEEGVRGTVSIL